MSISKKQVELFQSLFKGREDVYARRWEKENRNGYMLAYDVDWDRYEKHKALGGTFQDFKHKSLAPLTPQVIKNHLLGKETVGIYPLLKNNTSWFLAADFDKENWMEESHRFIQVCKENNIPAYLERSMSGNGGHVWIFLQEPYPAWKSRKIAFRLLRDADILSEFEKDASFDRLFPNQDSHSGKGFGNLIALPLNKNRMADGNTCFIDPVTGEAFNDQWSFLESIQKTFVTELDQIYRLIHHSPSKSSGTSTSSNGTLEIILRNQVWLNREKIPPEITKYIRDELNFINSDYLMKKKMGRSTWQTERYFKLIGEQNDSITIPRGFLPQLIDYSNKLGISYHIEDRRKKHSSVTFHSSIQLHPWQEEALEPTKKKDFGVIVAPPGSGKTIMGLELIARKQQPALIVVHRKQLFDQWIDRIESFLGIPEREIGKYSGSHKNEGEKISVGMIQTLKQQDVSDKIGDSFGTIIVDECHHVPAKTFRETITRYSSYYLYGLTATPMRKNNDENLIYVYIGNILSEIPSEYLDSEESATIQINIRETSLQAPFDYRIDDYETLSKILVFDTARNQLIVDDLKKVIDQKKTVLLLTERKAHIEVLNLYLKDRFETITLSGDDSKGSQQSKMKQIQAGHFQIVLSTGQFFGEGIDVDHFNCLFLVYPFAFKGKLIQYIGRITRSNQLPELYDYRDRQIDYFEKLFKKRNRFYNEIRKANQITMDF
ncbi:MAG: DEAD/DEAH box helicase family protein [Balneolaceae bacterium]|nr:DEAD/DEAH box helicase family protein [Balneolaceae bacterium]MDR9410712.1 DEAD/DEAH box helicase family protein [Balneolaceae bacterium]